MLRSPPSVPWGGQRKGGKFPYSLVPSSPGSQGATTPITPGSPPRYRLSNRRNTGEDLLSAGNPLSSPVHIFSPSSLFPPLLHFSIISREEATQSSASCYLPGVLGRSYSTPGPAPRTTSRAPQSRSHIPQLLLHHRSAPRGKAGSMHL